MKKYIIASFFVFLFFALGVSAQIPTGILVQIVKAEDERRFDSGVVYGSYRVA